MLEAVLPYTVAIVNASQFDPSPHSIRSDPRALNTRKP